MPEVEASTALFTTPDAGSLQQRTDAGPEEASTMLTSIGEEAGSCCGKAVVQINDHRKRMSSCLLLEIDRGNSSLSLSLSRLSGRPASVADRDPSLWTERLRASVIHYKSFIASKSI